MLLTVTYVVAGGVQHLAKIFTPLELCHGGPACNHTFKCVLLRFYVVDQSKMAPNFEVEGKGLFFFSTNKKMSERGVHFTSTGSVVCRTIFNCYTAANNFGGVEFGAGIWKLVEERAEAQE